MIRKHVNSFIDKIRSYETISLTHTVVFRFLCINIE